MEHRNKRDDRSHIKEYLIQSLYLKLNHSQQGSNSSSIALHGLTMSANPGKLRIHQG
jgi:hypothetical protein